jgi:GT2 family glycosyltransferase
VVLDAAGSPLVAIVVVTWNGVESSRHCLRSLERLNYPHYGICLIDNGSRPELAERIRHEFPEVTIVSMADNRGFSAGCNGGIAWARSKAAEYVLLINDDTVADPDLLQALVNRAEIVGRRAIVAPVVTAGDAIWSGGGYIRRPWFKADHYDTVTNDAREVEWASGCALLVALPIIDAIGPMDERFFLYLEDVDWCLRAREKGYLTVIEPEARIDHAVSATTGGLDPRIVRYYTYRNHYLLAFRHSGIAGRIFHAVHFAITLGKIALRSTTKRYRRSSWYQARTLGMMDFLRQRWGKAPYEDEFDPEPVLDREKAAA